MICIYLPPNLIKYFIFLTYQQNDLRHSKGLWSHTRTCGLILSQLMTKYLLIITSTQHFFSAMNNKRREKVNNEVTIFRD